MPDVTTVSRIVVIWIDWYPYHVARFCGLCAHSSVLGEVGGIELVGGIGVHAGLRFREGLPSELPVDTLLPQSSWQEVSKIKLAWILWRKLSQFRPTVVLVPGYYTIPAIAAACWAKVHRAQSVLMTESTAFDHPRVAWKEWLKRMGLRALFDWAIAGGKAHFDYLRQLGFPKSRVTGFYDVVDNNVFRDGTSAIRRHSETLDATPNFLYVGRLAEEKNVMGLLNSWMEYRNSGGTWSLILVGDGPEYEALHVAAAASAYNEEVQFPGLKTSRELFSFYAMASCFVLPSKREPWGLVVNEAMAAGLPALISQRCGCAMDLVQPGRNGFVFDPADQDALTELLHFMEQMPLAERAAMGVASAEIIQNFSPRHFALSVEKIAAASGETSCLHLGERMSSEPVAGGTQ